MESTDFDFKRIHEIEIGFKTTYLIYKVFKILIDLSLSFI